MSKKKKRRDWMNGDVSGKKGISRPLPATVYAQPHLGFNTPPSIKGNLVKLVDETLRTASSIDSRPVMKCMDIAIKMERINLDVEKMNRGMGDGGDVHITIIDKPDENGEDNACEPSPSTSPTSSEDSTPGNEPSIEPNNATD